MVVVELLPSWFVELRAQLHLHRLHRQVVVLLALVSALPPVVLVVLVLRVLQPPSVQHLGLLAAAWCYAVLQYRLLMLELAVVEDVRLVVEPNQDSCDSQMPPSDTRQLQVCGLHVLEVVLVLANIPDNCRPMVVSWQNGILLELGYVACQRLHG